MVQKTAMLISTDECADLYFILLPIAVTPRTHFWMAALQRFQTNSPSVFWAQFYSSRPSKNHSCTLPVLWVACTSGRESAEALKLHSAGHQKTTLAHIIYSSKASCYKKWRSLACQGILILPPRGASLLPWLVTRKPGSEEAKAMISKTIIWIFWALAVNLVGGLSLLVRSWCPN